MKTPQQEMVKLPWQRGDEGPAPAEYIFEGEPPTKEECPDGYITSSRTTKAHTT